MMNAAMMMKEEEATILCLHMDKYQKKRLFYMGIYAGAKIRFLGAAPLHDPFLFEVRGARIILRREDAKRIEVSME